MVRGRWREEESSHSNLFHLNKFLRRNCKKILQENVLTPTQINTFTQLTQCYEHHTSYSVLTGIFVTALIRASHRAKYNHFYLDVRPLKSLSALCEGLAVNTNFHIKVVGEVGGSFGYNSYNGKFSVDKAGDNAGTFSKRGSFYIQEMGDYCGSESRSSYFYVKKTGNCYSSHAKYSRFFLQDIQVL